MPPDRPSAASPAQPSRSRPRRPRRRRDWSGDQPTRGDRIRPDRLTRLILARLAADGPLQKWELNDRLQISEARILKELKALRKAGAVKVVGTALDHRQWALASYVVPPRKPPQHGRPVEAKAERPAGRYPRPLAERYADVFRAAGLLTGRRRQPDQDQPDGRSA